MDRLWLSRLSWTSSLYGAGDNLEWGRLPQNLESGVANLPMTNGLQGFAAGWQPLVWKRTYV